MFKAEPAVLRTMLSQLEQAIQDNEAWHGGVLRSLVCGMPGDPVEFRPEAHEHCGFGRWCRERAPDELRTQPTFAAIEQEHERLHWLARRMLQLSQARQPIDGGDFDEFAASAARLRTELQALRHEIQGALRSTDALTGAYGRVEMLPELREWRELARRDVQPCCLAFVDIDHLKRINDQHGHAVGDGVLVEAVEFLAGHLRPYDKIFRYGGDEFLVSLPGVDLATAQRIMERARDGLGRTPLAEAEDGAPVRTTASFGLAMLDPEASVEESIDRADKALLVAKAAGRNRVIAWDPGITTATIQQIAMDSDSEE